MDLAQVKVIVVLNFLIIILSELLTRLGSIISAFLESLSPFHYSISAVQDFLKELWRGITRNSSKFHFYEKKVLKEINFFSWTRVAHSHQTGFYSMDQISSLFSWV